MNKYIFIDHHNGHYTTEHPFISTATITDDEARKLQLEKVMGASRCGTSITDMEKILLSSGFSFSLLPTYESKRECTVINGISGNY